MGWFNELIFTKNGKQPADLTIITYSLVFHTIVAIFACIAIVVSISILIQTLVTPTVKTNDYESNQRLRTSITDYLTTNSLPDTTPMNQFSVATASFGGIYTEEGSYNGSVSVDAARLQVEAGSRAVVLDIWPDPADPKIPIVCTMVDTTQGGVIGWWKNYGGLKNRVGRYSNWQKLTRNSRPANEIVSTLIRTAFYGPSSQQKTDPFFLILKLHGEMTTSYLNYLGESIHESIQGHAMSSEWNKCLNQRAISTAPVNVFMSRVFIIVIPDINEEVNSLPGINTYAKFIPAFLETRLGEITNAIEQNPNTMMFEPRSISSVSDAGQPSTTIGGPAMSLAQTGICVVHPSVGGSTLNSALFSEKDYAACLQSGAQFVGVNLFSSDSIDSDKTLGTFFNEKQFGKYSFKKI